MDTSGYVSSIVLDPPSTWDAEMTPRTKMLMPTLITIHWKIGSTSHIVPEMLAGGLSRDVLGGVVQHTLVPSPLVIKIQDWFAHEQSNGYEYRLATGVLRPFTPEMMGCVRCDYRTSHKSHALSVLVVARVDKTMQALVVDLLKEPADRSSVRLYFGLIYSLLDIVQKVCGQGTTMLTALTTDNIGVEEDFRVVLLDVESAMENADRQGAKSLARDGVKKFFSYLMTHGVDSRTHSSWKKCTDHIQAYLFQGWWQFLHEIPSRVEISEKINHCLALWLDDLEDVASTAPSSPVASPFATGYVLG